MYEELEALKIKKVYIEVSSLPPGRKAIDTKWVLHIKRNEDGKIFRFKARLVAKGFSQIPGQDFNYTFAPVARWDSTRLILAIAALNDLYLRHIDIKTAFLNGPLSEEIYVKKPAIVGEGFWKLKKGFTLLVLGAFIPPAVRHGHILFLSENHRRRVVGFTAR